MCRHTSPVKLIVNRNVCVNLACSVLQTQSETDLVLPAQFPIKKDSLFNKCGAFTMIIRLRERTCTHKIVGFLKKLFFWCFEEPHQIFQKPSTLQIFPVSLTRPVRITFRSLAALPKSQIKKKQTAPFS